MAKPITIFISYSHKDDSFLKELQTFLRPYSRSKKIEIWTDKNIVAGQKWNDLIKAKLNESEIILFLVSPDFLASDYINDVEIKSAIENNRIITIPVIIRPIRMELLQISYLQVIPSGAKPVTDWPSRDNAWNDVIGELSKVFENINEEDLENDTNTNKTFFNFISSDKLMKMFFGFLVAVCFCTFLFGLFNRDSFYTFTSLAGLGVGSAAYLLLRRQLVH